MNEAPEGGLLLDDLRVVLDVGRSRDTVGERRNVGGPADLLELSAARQLLFQRDEIDRITALAERDQAVEDAAVRIAEEITRVDELRRVIEGLVVHEDRSKHGLFRFQVVRKRTLR